MRIFKIFRTDSWVKPFLGKYRKSLFWALALGFITFFCAGALMFNSGYLISRSASLPENILLVYVPIVLTRAFGIGRPVFKYLERLTSHNWVLKLTSELRLKLYNVLEKDAVFFKNDYQTGNILGLLSEDINHIQNLYLRTVFPTVIAWLLYIFIVIGLGYFSLWFALVMLLLFAVLIILLPIWSIIINGARQEQQKQMRNILYTELTDNVLGISDWIFSQRSLEYADRHILFEQKFQEVTQTIRDFDHKRNFLAQLVFCVIAIALLIWTSQYFPGSHGGQANWIAAFVLAIFPLIDAFAPLSDAAQETNIYQDSLSRLNHLQDKQAKRKLDTEKNAEEVTAPYSVEIKHLKFKYTDSSKVLIKNLDLEITGGEKIAILGKSGSGKSTLANLIRGDLIPTEGTVCLNQKETYKFGDEISNYIGVIHQAPYLFNTSIRNNLSIGNESASEQNLWDVLERVGLKKLVLKLPDKLDTLVDEAGLRFSGGERHRLALARILLKDVPIIILDEPTVSLDPLTEQEVIETFVKELQGKTLIWITHHLQGLALMDQVVFLENGRLQISGSPQELAQNNKHYRKLLAIDQGGSI
ncbi:transport ATP-binding protein CydD [Liquorilactobacillus aquaticus DSM 21051]|uniref:Transport ATP-binding protein CydD n=1 Tax=Liquorilactobacillus aquaticus DSM 21051 TaxID=1423725 RepID=A0A0R2CXH4_9LACO|nr:thiol reductant ABC exporter subunit CydC [Liquorilactobacillus aquaticus]KRM96133.1 transport ATP-binding protein CydD [Liquorilactobacillus aquaticus DSM 21051]